MKSMRNNKKALTKSLTTHVCFSDLAQFSEPFGVANGKNASPLQTQFCSVKISATYFANNANCFIKNNSIKSLLIHH